MLFLKNLLLRNFQGCCLLFNYQGSSLFLLIRSSFDILSRRFPFVKNFFHFLFAVCSGSVSPSQVSFNRLSHPHPSVKNFFHVVQRSALASCPTVALGLVLFIGLSQRQVVSYHGKSELSMFFLFFILHQHGYISSFCAAGRKALRRPHRICRKTLHTAVLPSE